MVAPKGVVVFGTRARKSRDLEVKTKADNSGRNESGILRSLLRVWGQLGVILSVPNLLEKEGEKEGKCLLPPEREDTEALSSCHELGPI